MNKRILIASALSLLLVTTSVQAQSSDRKRPYIYCNVYLTDMCFGIAAGDKLTMEIPRDYVLYHVSFSSGGTAKIYVGYNPDRRGHDEAAFVKCERPNGFGDCRIRRDPGGKIELIARATEHSLFVHVMVDSAVTPRIQSFIENIRACSEAGRTITCAE